MKFAKAMGRGSLKKEDLTEQVIVQEAKTNIKMDDPISQQEEIVKNVAAKLKENGFLGEDAGNSDPVALAEDALAAMDAVLDDSPAYQEWFSFDDQADILTLDNKNIVSEEALNEENNKKDPQMWNNSDDAIYEMDEEAADFQKNESFKTDFKDKSDLTSVVSELAMQDLASTASQKIAQITNYMSETDSPECAS